jgi:hypothetical protein
MANPIKLGYDRRKNIKESAPIGSIQKNELPRVSPTGYMINGTNEFNTQWPRHKNIVPIEM